MIALFSILFFCFAAAVFSVLLATKKAGNKKYVFSLRLLLSSALAIMISHIFIINTKNEKIASFFYSVFFIGIDFLLYSIYDFSRKYTKYKIPIPYFDEVFLGIEFIDSASLLLNIFFEHAFLLKKVEVPAFFNSPSTEIFKIIMKWPYQLHLFLSYFVISLLLITIFFRISKTPKMYRFVYTNILIAVLISILGDAVYVFTVFPIDFSIIFTAAAAILISFYAIFITPSKLIQTQMFQMVLNMTDGVILFDINGELVYKNDAIKNLEQKYTALGLNPKGPIESLVKGSYFSKLKTLPGRTFDEDVQKDDKTYSFHVSLRNLKDKKNTFLGAFIIVHDKTEEMEKLRQEKYLAIHDKLTGLYNREGFYEKVRSLLTASPDEKYLIICADIDNFKLINDLFGRKTGDDFLIQTAEAIKFYTNQNEVYARLESDRFAIFMKKSDYSEENLVKYPEKIAYIASDLHYPVNFHIGIYEVEDPQLPISVMCDRAFMAINTVKGNLQKTVAYYNSDIRNTIIHEQQLIGDFPQALASEQFQMYLQPQVKTDGNVYGAEALARWHHPKEGLMTPSAFIPLFESKGLITSLDQYMWNCAAKKLQNWKEQGITDMYISVNISPKDFVYIDIYQTFTDLVKKYDIEPQNLRLEIKESAVLMNLESQLLLINKLRDFGFIIEMNDFGSGQSSLNMLKNIQFDILKLDIEFLKHTENQERSLQILNSLIKLSKRLNMPVITEGVETKEQVDFLRTMGTDYYQGFYFASPMPVPDFELHYIKKN